MQTDILFLFLLFIYEEDIVRLLRLDPLKAIHQLRCFEISYLMTLGFHVQFSLLNLLGYWSSLYLLTDTLGIYL